MKFVALIPARGGSKRIPRKNLEKVGGVTLVERAIRCAKAANIIEDVYVSTDDPEITKVALDAGALVVRRFHDEPETPMDLVVANFLNTNLVNRLTADDCLILLEPTAPLRTKHDIHDIAAVMLMSSAPAARMVSVDSKNGCHGFMYSDAGLASAIRIGSFTGCLFPQGTLLLHGGDERAIDVDTYEDLERARALA